MLWNRNFPALLIILCNGSSSFSGSLPARTHSSLIAPWLGTINAFCNEDGVAPPPLLYKFRPNCHRQSPPEWNMEDQNSRSNFAGRIDDQPANQEAELTHSGYMAMANERWWWLWRCWWVLCVAKCKVLTCEFANTSITRVGFVNLPKFLCRLPGTSHLPYSTGIQIALLTGEF